jgi:6-phosphofructokinase 1
MIVETMGRHAGWLALEGGLAGGADAILIPEAPVSLEALVERTRERELDKGGVGASLLVCVAEGVRLDSDERPSDRAPIDGQESPPLSGVGQVLGSLKI